MTDEHEIERLETDGVPLYDSEPHFATPAARRGNGFLVDGWEIDRQQGGDEGMETDGTHA